MYYLTLSKNGVQLGKLVGVLRFHTRRLIKLDNSNNLVVSWNSTSNNPTFKLYPSTYSNNFFSLGTPISSSSSSSTSITYSNLPPGYYTLELLIGSQSNVLYTYQSDTYPCPYDPAYDDFFLFYHPCVRTSTTTPSGTPTTPTSLPTTTSNPQKAKNKGIQPWKISLIILASVAVLVIIIAIIVKLCFLKRKGINAQDGTETHVIVIKECKETPSANFKDEISHCKSDRKSIISNKSDVTTFKDEISNYRQDMST